MEWLTNNWVYILIAAAVLIYIFGKPSKNTRTNGKVSDEQARRMVNALVDAIEYVIADFLGERYARADRRKIAIGMVAVMAIDHITLDDLKQNPKLVVELAARSAAILTKRGEIPAMN